MRNAALALTTILATATLPNVALAQTGSPTEPVPEAAAPASGTVVNAIEFFGQIIAATSGTCPGMKQVTFAFGRYMTDRRISIGHFQLLMGIPEGKAMFLGALDKVRANPDYYCERLWTLFGPEGRITPGVLTRQN